MPIRKSERVLKPKYSLELERGVLRNPKLNNHLVINALTEAGFEIRDHGVHTMEYPGHNYLPTAQWDSFIVKPQKTSVLKRMFKGMQPKEADLVEQIENITREARKKDTIYFPLEIQTRILTPKQTRQKTVRERLKRFARKGSILLEIRHTMCGT